MTDKKSTDPDKFGELDRRSVLASGAATAATAILPGIAKAQSTVEGQASTRAAMYAYQAYPDSFSKKFFGAGTVVDSVKRIRSNLSDADIKWGHYQKFAPQNPRDNKNWDKGNGNGKWLYEHWEAAVEEAREDLKKMPIDRTRKGPDPANPADLKKNLLEHLDTAVRIALLKLPNEETPGFPIEVSVQFQTKPWRRHSVTTDWYLTGANPRLVITMTCPNGGWIGSALWRKYDVALNGKIIYYVAHYKVPPAPIVDYDQILFIFNGLESLPGGGVQPGILQPVLQWRGTEGWAIRSWYVPATYEASFDMMPRLDEVKGFTKPDAPAWTAAQRVMPGDSLTGRIVWDGQKYVSDFVWTSSQSNQVTVAAQLDAPGIADLTYPVAVIEAYRPSNAAYNQSIPRDGLVKVEMGSVVLKSDKQPDLSLEPDWDIGTDVDDADGIHHATNKLKSYKVKTKWDKHLRASQLSFDPK